MSKANGAASHGGSTAVRKRTSWFEMLGTERIVGPLGTLVSGSRGRPIHTPTCWFGRTLPATVTLVFCRVLPRARPARRVEAGLGELDARVGDLERCGARLAPLEGAHVPAQRLRHVLHEAVGAFRVDRPRRLERARPVPLDVIGLDRPRDDGVRRCGQRQHGSRRPEQQPGCRQPSSSHTASVRRCDGGTRPELLTRLRAAARTGIPDTTRHDADSRRAPHHHPLRPQAPRLRPAGRSGAARRVPRDRAAGAERLEPPVVALRDRHRPRAEAADRRLLPQELRRLHPPRRRRTTPSAPRWSARRPTSRNASTRCRRT